MRCPWTLRHEYHELPKLHHFQPQTIDTRMAIGTADVTNPQNESHKNVLGTTLQLFSKQPLTGFHRDGFCRVTAGDFGNHSVAGKHAAH
jgi:hypothetical protein